MGKKHVPLMDRVIKRASGCIEWAGPLDKDGYGQAYDPKTQLIKRAHRISWQNVNGEIPAGLCVLHTCDNPKCVNTDHLFLGTVSDNNKDRMLKGRTFKPFHNKRNRGIKDSELPWKVGAPCQL